METERDFALRPFTDFQEVVVGLMDRFLCETRFRALRESGWCWLIDSKVHSTVRYEQIMIVVTVSGVKLIGWCRNLIRRLGLLV